MSRTWLDLKSAWRAVVRTRFLSSLAVLAFALGIGVVSAVFAIFNGVLVVPLPYPEPDRLVVVYDVQPACATCPASLPKYRDWVERNRVFSAIAGFHAASLVMTGRGDPIRVSAAVTTASLADVFGVSPKLGRWFTEAEAQAGGPKLVVLSHGFWTRQLGGDPRAIGGRLVLDGAPYDVIGVMPESFSQRGADVFVPLQRALDPTSRGSHFLSVYARLREGMPLARAAEDMRALGETLKAEFHHNHGVDVRSYKEVVVGSVRTPLYVLLGVVGFVLLIACANVANLLLAAGLSRQRELAIRVSLGAGRGDLVRQLAFESLLLSLAGGALGLLLAQWLVRTFVLLAGSQLPRAANIAVDGRVLVFTLAVSVIVGLACGLAPLLLLRSRELASAIREGDTRTASGGGRGFGNGLVVAEIALAFALLVGAGLLVKNLVLLRSRDAGVRTDRIVAMDVATAGPRYQADAQVLAFYRELNERLRALPGVESAGMVSHLPMYRFGWNGEFSIEGGNPWGPDEAPLVEYRWLYGDYLKTLGVPLLGGRLLDERDGPTSLAVLVNRAMAQKFWPGQDPLGKRFGQDDDVSRWYEVVGVVGDVRSFGLARGTPFEFYRTLEQSTFRSMTVVVRTGAPDPLSVVQSVRQIVRSLDPALPVTTVQTMEQVVAASVGQPRFWSALTGLFGGLAGLLAMVGVYGVMAYNVRRHRRELGIRQALGADRAGLFNLVLGRGLKLAALGVCIGAGGAWPLSGALKALLNDVQPTDPAVFATTALGVVAAALLACSPAARAAVRVDPSIVLRDGA